MEIRAHTVSAGKAEGEAVVYDGPFSFLGDLDPATGKVTVPRHRLEGKSLVNKVFVFTTGKGASGGDSVAWMAKQGHQRLANLAKAEPGRHSIRVRSIHQTSRADHR